MVDLLFEESLIQLNRADPLAVARLDIMAGTTILLAGGGRLAVMDNVPTGHKLALRAIPAGESVLRYGQVIGRARCAIQPGEHIHSHNLEAGEMGRYTGWRVVPPEPLSPTGRTFLGYPRPAGRAGTRNLIAVISSVNCAAHLCTRIARVFTPERLAEFPNVDGVVAITPPGGCSMPQDGLGLTFLRRALLNLAQQPNIAAAVYVGLGCEVNQIDECSPAFGEGELSGLLEPGGSVKLGGQDTHLPVARLVIQEQGGFEATLRAGVRAVERFLPIANACRRVPLPLSQLCLGLECGGSDSWSGVTANPLVGLVSDVLVREGGTTVLSETPEIFGAEQILLERVGSDETGRKLLARFAWWLDQAERYGFEIDNNPSPGNKRGGLTTILEKSLGAAAKGGSTALAAVYEYAEAIEARGLVFMDTPGNDTISLTGMAAGGCNLALFTTGRGTPVGTNLIPTLKIASNTATTRRMADLIDYDAGRLLEGLDWSSACRELVDLLVETASGRKTSSELNGSPETEFVPWQPGPVL